MATPCIDREDIPVTGGELPAPGHAPMGTLREVARRFGTPTYAYDLGQIRAQISKIQVWVDESAWLPLQQKFFEPGSGDYFIFHYSDIKKNLKIGISYLDNVIHHIRI